MDFQSTALPTELQRQVAQKLTIFYKFVNIDSEIAVSYPKLLHIEATVECPNRVKMTRYDKIDRSAVLE